MKFKNKYGIFDNEEVEKTLRDNRFTLQQLADRYNLKKFQMVHLLRSMKVDFRNSLGDTRVKNSAITPNMHQLFLGTLLGDSYLVKGSTTSYQVGHSAYKQIDNAFHIAYQLGDFLSGMNVRDVTYQLGKSKAVELWTHHHEKLDIYYNLFYKNGKRVISEDGLQGLNDLGLAYWYMDDGMLKAYNCILCVGDISDNELTMIETFLFERFGLKAHRQVRKEGVWDMAILSESKSAFLHLVTPYIIPSMQYKLGLKKIPNNPFPEEDFEDRHKFDQLWYKYRRFSDSYLKFLLERFTDKQTAEILGVSRNTISLRRTKLNIGTKPKHTKNHLSDEQEQRLQALYVSGKNDYEIAAEMHLSRNRLREWRRNHDVPVQYKRMSLETIFPQPFYKKDWNNLNDDNKNQLIDILTQHYWQRGFPYPLYSIKELECDFQSLKNKDPICTENIIQSGIMGVKICNHFVHSRYSAYRFDRGNPIKITWSDKDYLRKFIKNRLRYFDRCFSDSTIRTGISLKGTTTNFPPIVAKFIYSKFAGEGKILDFSAGFGGRLLGFLANGKGSYEGVDPNQKSIEELMHLADTVCLWAGINRDHIVFHCSPFEDLEFIPDTYDLIFSSPPYFGLEKYSSDLGQSIIRYPEYGEWLEKFWFTTLYKSSVYLKKGGHLVFTLGNYKTFNLKKDTEKFMTSLPLLLIEPQLKISVHNVFQNNEKDEILFIFRKL